MSKGKVVVAMSGGVDSSVAAGLLKEEGYEVIGVTMRLWTVDRPDLPTFHRSCCSVEAVDDAQRVSQVLDIPWYYLNFERPFKTHVVDYFVREYTLGRTPHPCVACNQYLKFDVLLEKALALGADFVATGHYARVQEDHGLYRLLKAVDPSKDQSYVLYNLGQEEIRRTLMPIGHYPKAEVRELAARWGLPVADKPDSQDICFIPDNDYRGFVGERATSQPGPILDTQGRVLGTHRGLASYTVGQRQGLGLASQQRLYVVELDPAANAIIVGSEEEILSHGLYADEVSFVSSQTPTEPLEVTAKIRYKSAEAAAVLYPRPDGVAVLFQEPQRAVTPGQPVVFYQGEIVLGGGKIRSSCHGKVEWDPGL